MSRRPTPRPPLHVWPPEAVREAATAEEVRAALPGGANDSTVRTMLRVLVRKGHVRRDDRAAPQRYLPAIRRGKAQRTALRGLLDRFFGGSAESLVLKLIEDEHLSPEQLGKLSQDATRGPNEEGKTP